MQKTILHPTSHDRVTMQRKEEKRRRKNEETHGAEATEILRWVSPAVGLRDPRFFFFRVI